MISDLLSLCHSNDRISNLKFAPIKKGTLSFSNRDEGDGIISAECRKNSPRFQSQCLFTAVLSLRLCSFPDTPTLPYSDTSALPRPGVRIDRQVAQSLSRKFPFGLWAHSIPSIPWILVFPDKSTLRPTLLNLNFNPQTPNPKLRSSVSVQDRPHLVVLSIILYSNTAEGIN